MTSASWCPHGSASLSPQVSRTCDLQQSMTKVMDIRDYMSLSHFDFSIHLADCQEAKSHVGEPHLTRNCRLPPQDKKTVTTNETDKKHLKLSGLHLQGTSGMWSLS